MLSIHEGFLSVIDFLISLREVAYREALNILIEACYLPEYADKFEIAPLKRRIDDDLEME